MIVYFAFILIYSGSGSRILYIEGREDMNMKGKRDHPSCKSYFLGNLA